MKKIFFLLIAGSGVLSAFAQAPSTTETTTKKRKPYTHDSLLGRWVVDVNGLGGMFTQDITTNSTTGNYLNAVNYDNGGNLKFKNGTSLGFDAQLGFFVGHKRHFGLGAGFMYLSQMGDLSMSNPFHVEYQSTDYQGNTFRQIVTANQPINEFVKITNMNIPILLKYKTRFSKRFGFTADAGVLINVKQTNKYNSNATFDYEAIYQYQVNGQNVTGITYDGASTPAQGDVLYTKAGYNASSVYPTVQSYFNKLSSQGYNVGLGVAPKRNDGTVSYATGSIGFMVQPSINYFFSDHFALNLGGYYIYQPYTNTTNNSYRLTNNVGDYSSVTSTVKTSTNQSYGVNLGVRFLFGKAKDTDHDGVADKNDKCPTIPGPVQFQGCPDTDGDGIIDMNDECPTVAGILKFNGCPDSDGDGIADKDDACPFQAGVAKFNGCPDTDGDGIADKDDACPTKAGLAQYHGCPDTDGDGIPDNEDKCPELAGPASNNGCPVPPAAPAPVEKVRVATPILFDLNKTTIQEASNPILEEVVSRLANDEDAVVIVDGYTDATGAPSANAKLSVNRAKAVRAELIRRGVKPSKIKMAGHGSTKPAASNSTAEGRARNRRAVIHLNMVGN